MTLDGFPHSDIPGSKPACGSPGLIAACYVLRRLSAPRHPPSALRSLTIKSQHTCIRHQLSLCYPDSIFKERRSVRHDVDGAMRHLGDRPPGLPPTCHIERFQRPWHLPGTNRPGPATRSARAVDPSAGHPGCVVENTGIEPVTSWLQTRRSPS
jgi:hypothetical protein